MPNGVYIRTKEARANIGAARKKLWADPNSKYNSQEYKENKSKIMIAIRKDPNSIFNTEECRNKMGASHSGEKHYFWGKHHTKEGKESRRNALLGEKNHFFGKKHTEESKLKNSIAKKKQHKDPLSKYNTPEYKSYRKNAMIHASKFIKFEDTKPELKIKDILDNNKITYEKQKWIDGYRIDFFIPSHKLIIEADGQWTHGDPRFFKPTDIIQGHRIAKDKWEYDKQRDEYLKSLGYNIIRFWEYDIKKDQISVENKIKDQLKIF
jgi:very-short-patch-repair endonuclease